MKLNKVVILDSLYLLLVFAIINIYYYLNQVVGPSYYRLILAIFCVVLGIFVAFGSILGRVLISVFLVGILYYATGKIINLCTILLALLFLISIYFLYKYKKEIYHISLKYRFISLFCFFLAYSFSCSYTRLINKEDDGYCFNLTNSEYYYYHHSYNYEEFINRFGKIAYIDKRIKDTIDDYLNRNDYMYEITDYSNRQDKDTKENDESGIFSDKNLIIIHSDYLYECFINDELTPNIAHIRDNGIHVVDFDNPITKYGILDAEYMLNLSLFASGEDGCFQYLYDENYYGESLARTFNRNGYTSLMVVNDYEVFYNHERIYKTYGYYDLISPYDYGLDGLQDNKTMLESIPYTMSSNEKTLVYYSADEIKSFDSNIIEELREKYPFALDEDLLKIANIMDLDSAIAVLQKELDYYCLSEKTIIVLCGYNNNFTESIVAFGKETGESSNTVLCFYDAGNHNCKYKKNASSLDMLPTLANMFDLNYDNSYIIGRDIFNNDYHGMQITNYKKLKSFWYTDDLNYRYTSEKINLENDINVDDAKKQVEEMKQRIRFSYYWTKYSSKYIEKTSN